MALDGNHSIGSGGHVDDHNLIDAALTDVNAALGGMPKVVTGSYVGDGTGSRTIALGFTPKWLQVSGGNMYLLAPGPTNNFGLYMRAGVANSSYNSTSTTYPVIAVNGFTSGSSANASGTSYDYFAIG